jgi:oligopeptidase A
MTAEPVAPTLGASPLVGNPLLAEGGLPDFPNIRAEHVEPALRMLLTNHRSQLERLVATAEPSFDSVVAPLEDMQHRLTRTWSPVSHLNAVVNSEALRQSYNACLPLLSDYQTDLAQSEPLYRAYERIAAQGAANPEQRRVLDNALRDFRLAGVALDPARKQRFKQIMSELAQRAAKFEENVLDCTNAWSHAVTDAAELRGVNAAIIEQAARKAREAGRDGWLLGLDQPTYVAVVTDAESPALRRAFYEAWTTRASDAGPLANRWDNAPVIEEILKLRHEAAALLGYPSFAQYALATRMARTTDAVLSFLQELARAARPAALRDWAELLEFAGVQQLDPWDVAFHSERLQRERYAISQEELRPYFPLPHVLAGLFEVAERLFGIRIVEQPGAPVWHPDVRFYAIERAADAARIGAFYLDPYARPHKRSGAWMDEAVGAKRLPTGSASPVAHLVCNFLPPANGKPALLTHDDVVTMFHEFGHGLHHMLTRVGYPSIAGINGVAWDAVELPSQFLENYAWHPDVLARLSAHIDSGAPLPAEKVAKLTATRHFQAGLATVRQLEFALFDFRLHAEYDPARGGRVRELLDEVRREVAVIQAPPWNRMASSFGHIFAGGYAAGYYSYKWAEVLAADAFGAFEENGVFDRATAQRFLDSILARGGSRDALDAFIEFRGRKPDIGPLLRQSGMTAAAAAPER